MIGLEIYEQLKSIEVTKVNEIIRLAQVSTRKGGKRVVACPHCNRKIGVSKKNTLESHPEVSFVAEGFPDPCPMSGRKVEVQQISNEIGNEFHIEALRYVDGWITHHLVKGEMLPAYVAALSDIRVNVQAAIERIEHGMPMEAMSETAV